MNLKGELRDWNRVALKHRIQNLEKSHDSFRKVYVIKLKRGETKHKAERRYCSEEGITIDELENRPPGSLIVFLRTDFGD